MKWTGLRTCTCTQCKISALLSEFERYLKMNACGHIEFHMFHNILPENMMYTCKVFVYSISCLYVALDVTIPIVRLHYSALLRSRTCAIYGLVSMT